jgi:cytidylate kinase
MLDGVTLITGVMASGKSTVAQALAERLPCSAHVRGDVFRRMIVSGRHEMESDPTDEALIQLSIRYELAVATADHYAREGFSVVLQDIVLGPILTDVVDLIDARPRRLVVLAPSADAVREREAGRTKIGYHSTDLEHLDRALKDETPRFGLWIDTTDLTVAETVDQIIERAAEAEV